MPPRRGTDRGVTGPDDQQSRARCCAGYPRLAGRRIVLAADQEMAAGDGHVANLFALALPGGDADVGDAPALAADLAAGEELVRAAPDAAGLDVNGATRWALIYRSAT